MGSTVDQIVCSGCLYADSGMRLVSYTALDSALISASNCTILKLCPSCFRLAEVTKRFLENVKLARALLESVASLAEDEAHAILEKARLQFKSIINLKIQSVHTLDIDAANALGEIRNDELNNIEETINVKLELEGGVEDSDEEDFGNDDSEDHIDHVESDKFDPELLGAIKAHNIFMVPDTGMSIVKSDDLLPELLGAIKAERLEDVKDEELKSSESMQIGLKKKLLTKKRLHKSKEINENRKKNRSKTAEKAARIEAITLTAAELRAEQERTRREQRYADARFRCEGCVKAFNFRDTYERHMQLHAEGAGREACGVCGRRVLARELRAHREAHYRRYRCGECGLTRRTRNVVAEHYAAVHAADTLLQCALCPKTYLKRTLLKKHIAYHHGARTRIPCADCGKTFAGVECLREHVRMKHDVAAGSAAERSYACAECERKFRSPSHLRAHAAAHSSARDFYCVECDRHFKTETILRSHLKTASAHVDVKNLPLGCDYCEVRFVTKRAVQRHISKVHLNVKPHKCDQCDKEYTSSWSLREHRKITHLGFKKPLRFPCSMCDKIFSRNVILQGHLRTHTGERPYQCPKCPATFNQSGVLHTHNRLIHLKVQRNGAPKVGHYGRDASSRLSPISRLS